jgi:hypothetical protein
MTQKEAKELTLEMWRYLVEHPEYGDKFYLPRDLYLKIGNLLSQCPLCQLFQAHSCKGCPLSAADKNCLNGQSAYMKWYTSNTGSMNYLSNRKEAAERIVEIVSAWEPEEEKTP